MVVANVRALDLETFRTVAEDSKHRDRGIEAAIMSFVLCRKKERKERRESSLLLLSLKFVRRALDTRKWAGNPGRR